LRDAEVVSPPAMEERDRVEFGAHVSVREAGGAMETYRVVGVDEMDAARGWISQHSPLGRALLHARVGQRVAFQTPRGRTELEVVAIRYDEPAA